MTLYKGTTPIAGIGKFQTNAGWNIFDCKWSDHILNDIQWLRSDTFSWQSGSVYTTAYNHLVSDISGITAETETIGSYTVTFYRATDGHKICLADQETTVANIYTETGIAWYYILNTANTQFKLPRTKYGFEGLRDTVGDDIAESLPNITGSYSGSTNAETSGTTQGCFTLGSSGYKNSTQANTNGYLMNFNASNSSSTYQTDAPVQERATQMYLYFYVGEYAQTAIQQTAGLNSELFNGKADTDATNFTATGKSALSVLGLPTTTYTSITAGSSGATYTMPADGWLYVAGKTANSTSGYGLNATNNTTGYKIEGHNIYTKDVAGVMPVRKDDQVIIYYNVSLTIKLYYLQGEQ